MPLVAPMKTPTKPGGRSVATRAIEARIAVIETMMEYCRPERGKIVRRPRNKIAEKEIVQQRTVLRENQENGLSGASEPYI